MKIRNKFGRKFEVIPISRGRMTGGQFESLNSISKCIGNPPRN